MEKYRIRKVSTKDTGAVAEVEAVCFPAAEAATLDSFRHRICAFPECFFVAETLKGDIVGFINGSVTNDEVISDIMYEDAMLHDPKGKYQSIFGLDVIPKYQHHGIARALMEHMIEHAKTSGRKGLILTCKERLIGFYESFGYENKGLSASEHGGAVWYDMILKF